MFYQPAQKTPGLPVDIYSDHMIIGGLQKISLIDYPSKIAAVIFLRGCNFWCPYCHNPELVDPRRYNDPLPTEEVLAFLSRRKGQLEAVVITGGEPTVQNGLIDFIKKIRAMDYRVKLDTNGSRPEVLTQVIQEKLVDYIAMDIKAPLEKYYLAAGVKGFETAVRDSIDIIMASGIDSEFRTTVDESILSRDDLARVAELVAGCRKYSVKKMTTTDNLLGPKQDVGAGASQEKG